MTFSRESIRLRGIKFGAGYTRRLKRNHHGYGGTFYIDEVVDVCLKLQDVFSGDLSSSSDRRVHNKPCVEIVDDFG